MSGVDYNGSHSINFITASSTKNSWDDFHLIPAKRPEVADPQPNLHSIAIPGTDRRIDITRTLPEGITYGTRQGQWEFYIDHDRWNSWDEAYRKLVNTLHGYRVGIMLQDDSHGEESRMYTGRIIVKTYTPGPDYSKVTLEYTLESGYELVYTDLLYIPSKMFYMSALSGDYLFPKASWIGASAFYKCVILESVEFPVCTNIHSSAFYECSKLKSVSFPNCSHMDGWHVFEKCSSISEAFFPNCVDIGGYAFYDCTSLKSISFPNCNHIYTNAFDNSGIIYADFPFAERVDGCFHNCLSLKKASLPLWTHAGLKPNDDYAKQTFAGCDSLEEVYAPLVPFLGMHTFYACKSLKSIFIPSCSFIGEYAFGWCSSLSTIYLPNCEYIESYAFHVCTSLTSLYLLGSSFCSLENSCAFHNTPIESIYYTGTYGSIYVPASLYQQYVTDSVWSWYFDRFVAVDEDDSEDALLIELGFNLATEDNDTLHIDS